MEGGKPWTDSAERERIQTGEKERETERDRKREEGEREREVFRVFNIGPEATAKDGDLTKRRTWRAEEGEKCLRPLVVLINVYIFRVLSVCA